LCWAKGAVIMKMISNTNITSTSGVTLISAITPPPLPELNAMALYFFGGVAGVAGRPGIAPAPPASTRAPVAKKSCRSCAKIN
jgi:hypothetical protein